MFQTRVLTMMIVFLSAMLPAFEALAQNQGGGMSAGIGAGPMGYISLLNNGKVIKELDLTDDQQAKVAAAVGDAASAITNDKKNAFKSMARGGNPQELGNVLFKIMKSNQDKLLKKLGNILLPDQMTRLKQIHMQVDGPMALFEPEVVKALKITPDQQDKMKALLNDFQNLLRQNSTGHQGPNSGGGMMKLDEKMNKEFGKQLSDVLTDEQRAEFEKLKGPKADIGHLSFKMEGRSGPN